MAEKNSLAAQVTAASAKITGRRWCSDHQGDADATAGSMMTRNRSARWICDKCRMKSRMRQQELRSTQR